MKQNANSLATTAQQPLLPAEAWYDSPVQLAAVIGAIAQVASIIIRWFGLPVTDAQLDTYTADVLQIVTIAAGLWAIYKRSNSNIQPLTLTRKSASAQSDSAILDTTTLQLKDKAVVESLTMIKNQTKESV